MKLKLHYTYIGTLLFLACSPTQTLQSYEDKVVAIQASADSTALAIIAPYQSAIEEEINKSEFIRNSINHQIGRIKRNNRRNLS